MAFVYYMDNLEECGNMEVVNKLISSNQAVLVDDKIFSKVIIDNVDPAYESIKEFIPYMYEGYALDISTNNNLRVEFNDAIRFLDKVWKESTEDDIFTSENPEYIINELVKECVIKEINRRLDEIKKDFLKIENDIKLNNIRWS